MSARKGKNSKKIDEAQLEKQTDQQKNKGIDVAVIEEELLKAGYAVQNKIFLQNGPTYLKAVNKNGQTVFILIDGNSPVVSSGNVTAGVKKVDVSIIPNDVKISEMECSKSDVCGIAFECNDEFCTLVKDETSTVPIESNFTMNATETLGNIGNSPISYPIIKLSEIRQAPDYVLKAVDDCTRRLRNVVHRNAMLDFDQTLKELGNLGLRIQQFKANHEYALEKLYESIAMLELFNAQYQKQPPCSAVDIEKYRKVQLNLRLKNQMVVDLLRATQQFNSKKEIIQNLSNNVEELNQFMLTKLCDINKIVEN